MKKKNIVTFLIGIGVIGALVLAVYFGGLFSVTAEPGLQSGVLSVVTDDPYQISYPIESKLFRPVWGRIDCLPTFQPSAFSPSVSMALRKPGNSVEYYEAQVVCQSYAGTDGCTVVIDNYECVTDLLHLSHLYYRTNPNDAWLPYSSGIPQSAGTTTLFQVACYGPNDFDKYSESKTTPAIKFKVNNIPALKLESEGWTKSGWLDGSYNCILNSLNKAGLEAIQTEGSTVFTGLTQINGIERILPTQSKNIIVGYEEVTGFGNINPLGTQYNGKDVVCSFNTGIYEATPITTVGGVTYYKYGSLLAPTTDYEVCCLDGQCASGSYCENYECTTTPITCDYGQCNPQTYIEDKYQSEENGKFYLVTKTCGANGCVNMQKVEIKCTENYCQRNCQAGKNCYCDQDKGCQTLNILDPCPNGGCCEENNGQYTVQACLSGLQCCKTASIDKTGICKESCAPPIDCAAHPELIQCQKCYYTIKGVAIVKDGVAQSSSECCALNGGKYVTTTTTSWFGLVKKEVGTCEYPTPVWVWGIIGGVVLLIIILIIFMVKKKGGSNVF